MQQHSCVGVEDVPRSTCIGGKSRERMLNLSNIERVRYFYVIFSFLMYFLWEISTWDAFLGRDSGSPQLSFWPWLKDAVICSHQRNAYVSSPAIILSEFAKAYAPNLTARFKCIPTPLLNLFLFFSSEEKLYVSSNIFCKI